jgi:N-acetylglucosamine malate deacetylase 2
LRTGQITGLLKRTLLLAAHPDDEAVGAGALLQRMEEAYVVFCTDGGPKDSYFWKQYGSREKYVQIRHAEAESAANIAGIKRIEFLDFRDQELFKNLYPALSALERLILELRPNALLTHAYEGGHPDHDSCAFLAYVLGVRHKLPVWEMPLYHRNQQGICGQEFLRSQGSTLIRPTTEELEKKRDMVNAHRSQNLQSFDLTVERFRPQPSYDFRNPPEAEVINYEAWQWPMKATEVSAAFSALLRELQL